MFGYTRKKMKQQVFERVGADEIISLYKDKPLIKVLQGIRRCGKSFMLELLARKLRDGGVGDEELVLIDFEDFENKKFLDADVLYAFIKGQSEACAGKRLYLFFDEIQEVAGWEKCVNSLYSSKTIDADIYITGH